MLIVLSTASSTITLPLSVFFFGFHPRSINLSAICLREPTLKSCIVTLSLVLSCVSMRIGGNTTLSCSRISLSLLSNLPTKSIAYFWSIKNPSLSCLHVILLTSCSRVIHSMEKPLSSCLR